MPTRSVSRLHTIETQQLEQRDVLRREEHGRLGADVGVGVPSSRRNHEEVARLPLEGLVVDGRHAPPPHDAIDGATRLAVGTGPHTRTEELQVAGDGGAERGATRRIDVLEQDVVEGIGLLLGAFQQGRIGVAPGEIDVAARAPER